MVKPIQLRKQKHIELAQDPNSQMTGNFFDNYLLPYKALPEIDFASVDTSTTLFNKQLSQPLIIASMTGGTDHASTINRNLAIAAESTKVAMGVGSQRIALELKTAIKSFTIVRKLAPTTVIFANMAAVQLNYGKGIEDYQKIVDMIEADGLYLHLNPIQEALQTHGDTNFSNLLPQIEKLVATIKVPIFIKEVGHGIDQHTAKQLIDIGVAGIDVAGTGGTSWSYIESIREGEPQLADWFKNFGLPTPLALNQISKIIGDKILIASGGIRSPLDCLKSRMLGADYYSAANPFLHPALLSHQAVINQILKWQQGLKIAMFALGCISWNRLNRLNSKLIVTTKPSI